MGRIVPPNWGRTALFQAGKPLDQQLVRVQRPAPNDFTVYLQPAYLADRPTLATTEKYRLKFAAGPAFQVLDEDVLAPARGCAMHVSALYVEVNTFPEAGSKRRVGAAAAFGSPVESVRNFTLPIDGAGIAKLDPLPLWCTKIQVMVHPQSKAASAEMQFQNSGGTPLSGTPGNFASGYALPQPIPPEAYKLAILPAVLGDFSTINVALTILM